MGSLYLKDAQYLSLLAKIEKTIKTEKNLWVEDCTLPGAKSTQSNCGLCNEEFTERSTAMFPDQFPVRKSLSYTLPHHVCPFDLRLDRVFAGVKSSSGLGDGCFYTCGLRRGKRNPVKEEIQAKIELLRMYTVHKSIQRYIKWCSGERLGVQSVWRAWKHLRVNFIIAKLRLGNKLWR